MGEVGDGEDIGWGYGQVSIEGKKDIGKRGIGFSSDQDGDKSGRLHDSGGEW